MSNDYKHGIEVAQRNPNFPTSILSTLAFATGSLRLMYQADFVLDLVTFKVLKHRYGGSNEHITPAEAAEWLTYYLNTPNSRVLLLTD